MKKADIMASEKNFKDKYVKTNAFTRKLIDNFYDKISRMVKDMEIETILEVGCGHGFSTQYLADIFKGRILEASEFEVDLIPEARTKNPQIRISQESIYNLPRSDSSFDLIVSLEVLEHLDYPCRALEELKRVSNKYCLLSVPSEPIWRILNVARGKYLKSFGNTPGHINHWSRSGFIKFVGGYFHVEKIETPLPWTIILASK